MSCNAPCAPVSRLKAAPFTLNDHGGKPHSRAKNKGGTPVIYCYLAPRVIKVCIAPDNTVRC